MNELDEPKTMTYREAARFLGVKINSIYPLVTRGRLHPISVEGSQVKLLPREEVERYAERLAPLAEEAEEAKEAERHTFDTVEWLADEASTLAAVSLSACLYFRGLIDSGDTSISPRLLEQAARLRMTAEGRGTLAGIAEGLRAALEGEPLKSAPLLATERERLLHLYAVIIAALAEPIKRRHVKKPTPTRQ